MAREFFEAQPLREQHPDLVSLGEMSHSLQQRRKRLRLSSDGTSWPLRSAKIKCASTSMRRIHRQHWARRLETLYEDLREAVRLGRKAEVYHITHMIAGRGRGSKNSVGGMSAQRVLDDEEAASMVCGLPHLPPL